MSGGGRRERKRRQTADHLADTAWELFESRGYEAVTMEAIAEAADVAKGTLYNHFPVKEALLRHRFRRQMGERLPGLLAELATLPTATARLGEFLARNADWAEAHRPYLPPYLHLRMSEVGVPYDLDSPHRSGLETVFTGMIAAGQESGEFRPLPDATTSAHYLEFLYLAALLRWLNGVQGDLHAEFRTMLDLFLRGMTP